MDVIKKAYWDPGTNVYHLVKKVEGKEDKLIITTYAFCLVKLLILWLLLPPPSAGWTPYRPSWWVRLEMFIYMY